MPMRKILFWVATYCFWVITVGNAQQRCGLDASMNILELRDPTFRQRFESRKEEINRNALSASHEKNSGTSAGDITIPVVFHIVVNQGQYEKMGGKWGIESRCKSQIDVLNEDFNRSNFDSSLVPELWKPLYGNVGVHFALAHTNPYGYPSPGYTIRLISKAGVSEFDSAKYTNLGGTDAWDVNKYINVWCVNFDGPSVSGLIGVTQSRSMGGDSSALGICMLYNVLGRRQDTAQSFPGNSKDSTWYDLGRTLTHEMGHFFEIWHVWGDDNGLCPWNPDGRRVLPDLPPQGGQTTTNPRYNIPGGTIHDGCSDSSGVDVQPIGIACLDFMDYTDDSGMHLFTPDQALVMRSMFADPTGESYSLTQHPEVLEWPVGAPQIFNVFPNPTTGVLTFYYDNNTNPLQYITICDVNGIKAGTVLPTATPDFVFDISWLRSGVYILKIQFLHSVATQKVVLYKPGK